MVQKRRFGKEQYLPLHKLHKYTKVDVYVCYMTWKYEGLIPSLSLHYQVQITILNIIRSSPCISLNKSILPQFYFPILQRRFWQIKDLLTLQGTSFHFQSKRWHISTHFSHISFNNYPLNSSPLEGQGLLKILLVPPEPLLDPQDPLRLLKKRDTLWDSQDPLWTPGTTLKLKSCETAIH